MVAVGRDEHLGLVAQAAEGDRMDDAVAVALEDVARAARRAVDFPMEPAARFAWLRGEVREEESFGWEFLDRLAGGAGPAKAVDVGLGKLVHIILRFVLALERPDQQPRPALSSAT